MRKKRDELFARMAKESKRFYQLIMLQVKNECKKYKLECQR